MKADLFLVRPWAGTNRKRWWATIWWKRTPTQALAVGHDVFYADANGACLDCEAAKTKAEAEKIGRAYAKKLGLTLPKARYT